MLFEILEKTRIHNNKLNGPFIRQLRSYLVVRNRIAGNAAARTIQARKYSSSRPSDDDNHPSPSRSVGKSFGESERQPSLAPSSASSRLPRLYTTRESIQEVLQTDRYSTLLTSGWHLNSLPRPANPPILVLQKEFPPRQPFVSWDAIVLWVQDHVRPIANELDHHPDISITKFNHLTLTLFTHSMNALTPRDFRLALRIDQVIPKNK